MNKELIYGKDSTERIVSVEVDGDNLVTFQEMADGTIVKTVSDASFWFLTPYSISSKQRRLEGNQHFKYMAEFSTKEEFEKTRKVMYQRKTENYCIWDPAESNMVRKGITYFKGMKPNEVSVLSFDIETDGLKKTAKSEIYIITNTYRSATGEVSRQAFFLDEYESQKDMLEDWCDYVRHMNPSIVLGHNIIGYDLDYIRHVADLCGAELSLGRDNSPLRFNSRPSSFRKDGSQSYDYYKAFIFGRSIIDTFHTSIKYDIGRKFESYGLKAIIRQLGMEKEGRSFIDASKMRQIYEQRETNPELWMKSKQYAIEDSDDALKLFDLMIPATFYFCNHVSKPFQEMNVSATGSQINNIMVRAYLQDGHSVAKASEAVGYEGAISYGIPGIYSYGKKFDISSLYPSIMRQYRIHDSKKDPKRYFLILMDHFTVTRLENKRIAKETKDQYYIDMEQKGKIFINSGYGFLGATGLNYNSPENAALVTKHGRDIISKATVFATSQTVDYWKGSTDNEDVSIQND